MELFLSVFLLLEKNKAEPPESGRIIGVLKRARNTFSLCQNERDEEKWGKKKKSGCLTEQEERDRLVRISQQPE